ncbi:putative uncharacterized protein [Prevotella sp. CAG:755]|nr:putative uncharacterized protein [Prevotella sp. CAG:755]
MNAELIIFLVLALCVAVLSVMTVTTKSIIRAATYLLFVLFGTAGFYFLMGYTFLGSVQVMVYAGGIIVLYVFSILLTSGAKDDKLSTLTKGKVAASLLSSLVGLGVVLFILLTHQFKTAAGITDTPSENLITIDTIGQFMLSTDKAGYLLPFEAVSVLLLACIIGGLVIARKR